MVKAKILLGYDNKSYMYSKPNYPHCCESCHYPTKQVVNPAFHLVKRTQDVSYTYDLYLIVSEKFKLFCETRKYKNLIFHPIEKEPRFFFCESSKIIPLDYQRREVMFIDKCELCDRYAEVIGATPSFVLSDTIIEEKSFYRSEFDFGSYEHKSPLVIVSLDVAEELSKQKFRGICLKDVIE